MKDKIVSLFTKHIPLPLEKIAALIEIPKETSHGDYAFPCFALAAQLKKNPAQVAHDLAPKLTSPEFEKVEARGPYINFFLNRVKKAQETLHAILSKKGKYGTSAEGKGKTLVVEFSSPNIAKPFGIGHLRSTIIGNSLAHIAEAQGYKVVTINYLGDWGTQFGKLMLAYAKWGDPQQLKQRPIRYLLDLYVRINQAIKESAALEDEARVWFKKLETGDAQAVKLWKQFKALTLKEFERVYKDLGITFTLVSGESHYSSKIPAVIAALRKKGLAKESEGALVVDLEPYGLGVCLLQKMDGTTIYASRDLAAAIDRYEKFKFSTMLYEVGAEQKLHFQQFFKVLELLGYHWAKACVHVEHGLYLGPDGKKFATREGKLVFMEEIVRETRALAEKAILEREKVSPTECTKRAVAIARAAIVYGDLKTHRAQNSVFDIERFLSFEGDTGPYLLYAYARTQSLLAKARYHPAARLKIPALNEHERHLIMQLAAFPALVSEAHQAHAPNLIATYAYKLSQSFNEFYHAEKVIGSDHESFRLALVDAFSHVLKNALALLGIPVLKKM